MGKKHEPLQDGNWEVVDPINLAKPWEAGMEVVGRYLRTDLSGFINDDGTEAKVLVIEDAAGDEVILRLPAILAKRIAAVAPGRTVKITCQGKIRTRAGRSAWDFELAVKK